MGSVDSHLMRRTDATARLLLLVARESLTSSQIERARDLASGVTDWCEAVRIAQANFSLPFLDRHLPHLGQHGPPPPLANTIRRLAMANAMHSLRILASLARFQERCVEPANAKHVYLKGPALAAAYFREPALRIYRDVDVLVAQKDFGAVAYRCLVEGFGILLNESEGVFATDAQDIDFLIRRSDVLSVVDAAGVHFEIHRKIEKQTTIFPTNDVLASAETIRVAGQSVQAMEMDRLFCYVAYHHSRHFWSRLHWVADLHAIMAHPRFDADRVLQLSERLGLSKTVAAAIAFAHLTEAPETWDAHLGVTHEGVFLDACLRGLPGDQAFEVANLKGMFLFEFANPWQIDPRRRLGFWAKSAWHRLAPNKEQYLASRRSRQLEFLYVVENASSLAGNALARITGR